MAEHLLAPYWAVKHRRPNDYAFFKSLGPPVVKIMDGGPPDYAWVKANLPSATMIVRDWLIDDNNHAVWEAALDNPAETGKRVAGQMIAKAHTLGLTKADKVLLMGFCNEPHVWEDGGREAATLANIAYCDELAAQGWKGLVLNLSVGWPRNMGPDLPPRWDEFPGLEAAIKRGGHTLGLHEYWPETGPANSWGWLAGRALKCTWNVPIIIGECSMSYAVTRTGIPTAQQGWRLHISPEVFAAQIVEYHNRMAVDSRIKGLCLFLCDYANREWEGKDIEPAYPQILNRKGLLKQPATGPAPVPPNPTPPVPPNPTPPTPTPAPVALQGRVVSAKPNDGTTYVYGQAPQGAKVYFAWRGNPAIAEIQSGPHPGYEGWKPGYYNIPLYVRGVTPCVGDWDIWASVGGQTSARVPFHTDGRGGQSNEVNVDFAFSQAPAPEPEVPMGKAWRFPLDKLVVTQWWGRTHGGIDYSCVQGTPVKSSADGVVVWVDKDTAANGGYGLYVRVRHQQLNIDTLYAHLSRQDVKVGQAVKFGQVIGLSGNTGNSTGPHLHYEVRLITDSGQPDLASAGETYRGRVDPMAWSAGLRAAA
jgi:hypothetical protein